mmetsp:Transcript_10369/g.16600  ORF Transcript_10369/g.16600 Transcript_10369/m.16600 type:complete len:226 (-) Transcript_10369:426-1103(-)
MSSGEASATVLLPADAFRAFAISTCISSLISVHALATCVSVNLLFLIHRLYFWRHAICSRILRSLSFILSALERASCVELAVMVIAAAFSLATLAFDSRSALVVESSLSCKTFSSCSCSSFSFFMAAFSLRFLVTHRLTIAKFTPSRSPPAELMSSPTSVIASESSCSRAAFNASNSAIRARAEVSCTWTTACSSSGAATVEKGGGGGGGAGRGFPSPLQPCAIG